MYLLGHLGIGLGIAWFASTKAKMPIDYRLILLGAILPDLIDKPLGYALGLESRLWAHTLVFLGMILGFGAIPRVRVLLALGIGVATHILLDRMWNNPYVLLWPALGSAFPPDGVNLWNIVSVLWQDPVVLGGELVGASILAAFARMHGIRSWSTLVAFLRNGRPVAPEAA
ncbi:MAG: metal-dependent hydrolase [Methanobacteriota archaeon]